MVARDIAADVSMFLAFANQQACSWRSLLDVEKCKAYVDQLQTSKIGVSGIVTKLDRLLTAMCYVRREGKIKNFPQSIME